MSGMFQSILRIRLIAGNTFLEAVRQKFFNSILLIALALVGSSHFFQQFDFGSGELKFINDFGFGALFFFGSILAIFATTQLFFNEMENRTALTVLAKPIYKLEFLAGKFTGVFLLMFVFTVILLGVLAGILYWRETVLMGRLEEGFDGGRLLRYGDIALFGFVQWIKFGVISAIALLIASFSNTNLYTVVVSFIVLIICQLQYIARDAYADIESAFVGWLVWLLGLVFPNFQIFNIGDQLVYDVDQPFGLLNSLRIAGYGAVYIVVFLLLAQANFRQREI